MTSEVSICAKLHAQTKGLQPTNKKILIVLSTPRKSDNINKLCDTFPSERGGRS